MQDTRSMSRTDNLPARPGFGFPWSHWPFGLAMGLAAVVPPVALAMSVASEWLQDFRLTPLAVGLLAVLAAAGTLLSLANVLRPLSAERRLKEQLIEAEKLAAVGQLVAGVAHELNNPLSVVVGLADLLVQEGECSPAVQADLEKIRSNIGRCRHIVQNLLGFSRRHRAERKTAPAWIPIQAVVDLLKRQYQAEGLEIAARYDEDLPACLIDVFKLQQVFLNLVQNAHDAIRSSGVGSRIRVTARRDASSVMVEVCDDGPGVPTELRERIFEAFFTTKDAGQGTGLGLAICREIAEEHHGRLELVPATDCECSSPHSTCFRLSLPIANAAAAAEPEARSVLPVPVAARILIVDDDPDFLDVLGRMLRAQGHQVVACGDGERAASWISNASFDLVVTDYKMPGVDGAALYRFVQSRRPELASRFLVATGDTSSGEARRWLEETGVASIGKPFSRAEVLEKTAQLLGSRPALDTQPALAMEDAS